MNFVGTLFLVLGAGMVITAISLDTRNHHRPVRPMTTGRATTNAVRMTGRLMQCFGGCEADQCDYQCRPVGLSQQEHPELLIKPVVICWDQTCEMVSK